MYMDALESEVESLSSEVTRLRLMLHRVTQVMEAPPMSEPTYSTAAAATTGEASSFAPPMPSFSGTQAQHPPQHADPIHQLQQLLEFMKQAGSSDLLRQLMDAEKSVDFGDSTDSHMTKMGSSFTAGRRKTKAPPLNDHDLGVGNPDLKARSSFSAEDVQPGPHYHDARPSQPFMDNLTDAKAHKDERNSDTMYLSQAPGMWSFPTPTMVERGDGVKVGAPHSEGHQKTRDPSSSPPTAAGATDKRLSVAERLQQLKDEPSSSNLLDDSGMPAPRRAMTQKDAAAKKDTNPSVHARQHRDSSLRSTTESMVMPSMNTTEYGFNKANRSSQPAAPTASSAPAAVSHENEASSVSFSYSHFNGDTGHADDGMPKANMLAQPPTTTTSPNVALNTNTTAKFVPAQTSVLSHNSSEEEDPNVPIMGQGQDAVILGVRRSIGQGGGSPPLAPRTLSATAAAPVDTTSPNMTPNKGVRTQTQPRESILDRLRRHTGGYDSSEDDDDDENESDAAQEQEEEAKEEEEVQDEEPTNRSHYDHSGEAYEGAHGSQKAASPSQSRFNTTSPDGLHYSPGNGSRNENAGYSYGTLDAYSLGWHSPSQQVSPQQPAIDVHNNSNVRGSPSPGKSVSGQSVADYDWGIASSPAAGQSVKSSHSELPSTGYYDF